MSDDADRAECLIEQHLDDALAEAHEHAIVPEVEPTGVCLYCHIRLLTAKRWCDADCRNDWDHERKLRMLQGVK
jgi:hypothetical protein